MISTITASGHVCYDSACDPTLGFCTTEADAETDARECLTKGRVRFISTADAADDGEDNPLAVYGHDLRTMHCTAALMDALASLGAVIAY